MFTYVRRRVFDTATAARVERRVLGTRYDDGWHWVDVLSESITSACGTTVDSFSQWQRDAGGRQLHMCERCVAAMPQPGDTDANAIPDLFTSQQVAAILKISRQAVLQRADKLGGIKLGDHVWVFKASTVRRLASERAAREISGTENSREADD